MPPISQGKDVKALVEEYIAQNKVMVFSKTTCPFCLKVKDLFKSLNVDFKVLELDTTENGVEIQDTLLTISGLSTVPNVFINKKHIGGCDSTLKAHSENRLLPLINSSVEEESYDYDLIVIGGGSGGLAASKEAAQLGMKVCVFDFVRPTPKGTTWGLGGTCVNVGCIPKKLMHQAALLGEQLHDAAQFGWGVSESVAHTWSTMVTAIQSHIGSLNWNYRVQLREKSVDYKNAYAEFIGPHTIKAVDKRGKEMELTAKHFIIATGERPRYPDVPGAKEYCITSDDLFSLSYPPGKTLCIGASYVSLECAGFLKALGFDVTVMVRSILLRGFDQQMAEVVGGYMEAQNAIKFIRGAVPLKIEEIEKGTPGKYRVTAKTTDGEGIVDEYNTIVLAIGRDPCTKTIGLDKVGVKLNPKNGRVITNEREQTNVPHIYAIGDIVDGAPELTPVAIQAGRLLTQRLFGGSKELMDYVNVATTVFTPLEYGCIGYSEEAAIDKFGEDSIEVYHTNFQPLEWTVAKRDENSCYAKLICLLNDNERVIGFHLAGPNAGEMTQGYAVAMKLGAKKSDFDSTVGIHPTCSEVFTTLSVSKRSGMQIAQSGC